MFTVLLFLLVSSALLYFTLLKVGNLFRHVQQKYIIRYIERNDKQSIVYSSILTIIGFIVSGGIITYLWHEAFKLLY